MLALVPVAPAGAWNGDAAYYRLSGRYRVHWGNNNPDIRWRLTPLCDRYACTTRIRSGGGFHGLFRLDVGGTYWMVKRYGRVSDYGCDWTNPFTFEQHHVERAYTLRQTIRLTQLRGKGGGNVAVRFVIHEELHYKPVPEVPCRGFDKHDRGRGKHL